MSRYKIRVWANNLNVGTYIDCSSRDCMDGARFDVY